MAKQPDDDNTTPYMFGSGHPCWVSVMHVDSMDRVRRFRSSRKLIPASSNVACEVCGKKHDGDCRVCK